MNDKGDGPKTVRVLGDGAQQFTRDGVAAKIIWFATQYAEFLNSPMVKGELHLHFSGRDDSLNVVADLTAK